jgi:hypothetical protein
MDAASAPWWVPLAAAGIALAGVIVGQSIAAVIDSRRYRREEARRKIEHWRNKRFDAYSEFLGLVDTWTKEAASFMNIATSLQQHVTGSDEIDDEEQEQDAERILDLWKTQGTAVRNTLKELGHSFEALPLVSTNV